MKNSTTKVNVPKTCIEIDKISMGHFTGIPDKWWSNLTYTIKTSVLNKDTKQREVVETKKPYLEAIIILADIFNWYKTIQREDDKGNPYITKKFKGEMLERKASAFSEKYGFGEKACYDAITWLKAHYLIKTKSSRILHKDTEKWENLYFIEPIVKTVKVITDDIISLSLLVETYQEQTFVDGRFLPSTSPVDGRNLLTTSPVDGSFLPFNTKYILLDNNNRLESKDAQAQKIIFDLEEKEKEKDVFSAPPKSPKKVIVEKTEIELIFEKFDSVEIEGLWQRWKKYKVEQHKFLYKSDDSELMGIKKLHEFSKGNYEASKKIIEEAIGNGYKGFFELKKEDNKNGANNNTPKTETAKVNINDRSRYEMADAKAF